jgi:hypothetical protein
MPKTYPGLSMFEEAAPMPYCDHEPGTCDAGLNLNLVAYFKFSPC